MCLTDIDGDFKASLAKLVPLLLAPEQLVEKEIGGSKVTCRDLLQYFKVLQILPGLETPGKFNCFLSVCAVSLMSNMELMVIRK